MSSSFISAVLLEFVLSPRCYFGDISRLDCLQALRDKTLYRSRAAWRSGTCVESTLTHSD